MASLKLLVHKEQNKVLCAESDKDFVDYLFSLLTMPLGAIVQRIGSKIGSLNTLHKSVGDLETQLLQTDACKEMLHSPKSASEEQSKNLKVNIDPYYPSHTDYYVCPSCIGSPEKIKLASTGYRVRCRCGDELNRSVKYKKSSDGKDGVFVKEDMKFMITDDLQVSPVSTLTSFELLKKLGISDASVLEVRIEHLGDYYHGSPRDMRARLLLKHLLFSKTPLTDTFLGEKYTEQGLHLDVENTDYLDRDTDENSKKINIKLLLSKSNKKVLYAEAGEEFPDLLFSFLTFPLGAVVKLLGECGMGCVDNLYKSVKDLSLKDCMKSEECKAKLLSPKIASYFGSKNQLLKIEEQVPLQPKLFYCSICYDSYVTFDGISIRPCSHGPKGIQLRTINPKHRHIVHDLGGAFVAGPAKFTVTDELVVKPLSPISGISFINKFSFPISDLEEVDVSVGEMEALSLLRTSLISNTVFSDVFCSKKPQQSRKRSSEGSVPPDKRPKTETECL